MTQILRLPSRYEQYFISILLTLVFPLISLLVEYFFIKPFVFNTSSILLGISVYNASVGFSSQRMLTCALGFVTSFCSALLYGFSVAPESKELELLEDFTVLLLVSTLAIFFQQLIERYNRHVVLVEEFWSFR